MIIIGKRIPSKKKYIVTCMLMLAPCLFVIFFQTSLSPNKDIFPWDMTTVWKRDWRYNFFLVFFFTFMMMAMTMMTRLDDDDAGMVWSWALIFYFFARDSTVTTRKREREKKTFVRYCYLYRHGETRQMDLSLGEPRDGDSHCFVFYGWQSSSPGNFMCTHSASFSCLEINVFSTKYYVKKSVQHCIHKK